MHDADVIIRPELDDDVGCFAGDEYHETIYQSGRTAALKMLPQIQALMQQKSNDSDAPTKEACRYSQFVEVMD